MANFVRQPAAWQPQAQIVDGLLLCNLNFIIRYSLFSRKGWPSPDIGYSVFQQGVAATERT
jgi:hypothetical protein